MDNINEEKKKRYALVISLLVLMVCVVGSTYAYFALTASNNNISGKVGGTSLDLTVTRILPTNISEDDMMIPQLEGALDKAISEEYSCIDDNGHLICQVYEATVTNLGSESVTLNGNISFTGIENMPNLKWKLLTDSRTIDSSATSKSATTSEALFVEDLTLTTEQDTKTKTYYFVFWIEETGELQTDNGEFRAVINFNSPNAESGVTSTITPEAQGTLATTYVQSLYDSSKATSYHIGGDESKPSVSMLYLSEEDATDKWGIMLDNNGEYRYYGKNPNNYVDFNGELWRIISSSKVFLSEEDTTGSMRLRIIKDTSIENLAWDSDEDYNNNWADATLMCQLNTMYYNDTVPACTGKSLDSLTTSLNAEARNLIDDALWYLGGGSNSDLYADDYYTMERGTAVADSSYPYRWTAKVGIMYPSDYAYAADLSLCKITGYSYDTDTTNCLNTDWLFNGEYQWLMSPNSGRSARAWYVYETGYVDNAFDFYVDDEDGVRPLAVLKSDVTIVEGEGTSGNPYRLELGT